MLATVNLKAKSFSFKRTNWILTHILKKVSISGVPTFNTDTNRTGLAEYKSGKLS